ncbi:MAG: thioredoxin [Bacteroidales bacterium]|jgi:thioredoxin 1|nr:thioredoxin [Bacteroidales bacterium]
MAISVDDSNFEEVVLKSGKPVVVDFWATWCGPCNMLSPVVDELGEEYKDKIKVVKCNVDEASETPVQYGIRNIPTLLFFKDGKVVDRLVGALPKVTLDDHMKKLL